MDKKFEIGDVVELKSGGPNMTITRIINKFHPEGAGEKAMFCECVWFVDKIERTHEFVLESLQTPDPIKN
ncbi:MAG: DUF2158 domain-containing protein [Saprospiraceae bacterium]|nr:DUF2158 domain-containing protein [Candidatus Defluviibacterium haderslevense]MBK7244472.1 DUF2158 domain-containing protein [Candidatus Defluviibacterium haderslevense]